MGRKYFKYIIWDLGMYGEFPVIFPNYVQHAELQHTYNQDLIIAAGDGKSLWKMEKSKSLPLERVFLYPQKKKQ